MNPLEILNKYFGYQNFKPVQEEIINSILHEENVLAILPTGAGKSLCYQVPALMKDSFSIVISPLIALMKDQVDSLNSREKCAAFINSTLDFSETEKVLNEVSSGKIKLLYLSPERLENLNFAERFKTLNPFYIFIDEAHCISQWGHNFRPSYRKIKDFAEFIKLKKISAFTATATPEVRDDIIHQLELDNPKVYVRGFERDNLSLNVIITNKKKEKTLELVSKYQSPAIVYTSTRRNAEELVHYLKINKLNADFYHAGLSAELRRITQDDFQSDRVDIIAATNAFGMGIDKKDIRLIIHYNMPGSIENYYQEIGRAGRDSKESHTFLLFEERDRAIQESFINNSNPSEEQIKTVYDLICDFGKVAVGRKNDKIITLDKNLFAALSQNKITKSLLNSSLGILEQAGYVETASGISSKHYAKFLPKTNELKNLVKGIKNNELKDTILILLHDYGNNMINSKVSLNMDEISRILGATKEEVVESLTTLSNWGIIDYDQPTGMSSVNLTQSRIKSKYLNLNYDELTTRSKISFNKLDQMINYVFTNECRFNFILKYFGEDAENYKCGKCDICLNLPNFSIPSIEYLQELILRTLHESKFNQRANELFNVLLGSSKKNESKTLSTFGTCVHFTKDELKTTLEILINQKFVVSYSNKLFLDEKGKNFFAVQVEKDDKETDKKNSYEEDLELFNLLRQARSGASKKFSQTINLICPDEILREIAKLKPSSPSKLFSIKGFNQRMYNKVGTDFLEIIKEHSKKTDFENRLNHKNIPKSISDTLSLLNKRYSLKDIASLTKLPEAVVSMQIETIIEYIPEVEVGSLFEKDELKLINAEIDKGITDIKELKKSLSQRISYAKLRIALAKSRIT